MNHSNPLSAALVACALPLLTISLGCASRNLASTPHQPTVLLRESQGWTRVRQPGWFSISMPHAPELGELKTNTPQGGVLVMKQLSASTKDAYLAIAYAELEGFDDHDAMLAEVRNNLERDGAQPIKNVDIEVAGRQGVEGFLDLPPSTTLNPSKGYATARVRVLLDQSRAYVLIGVEPTGVPRSVLAQFFDSFEFAAPSKPSSP